MRQNVLPLIWIHRERPLTFKQAKPKSIIVHLGAMKWNKGPEMVKYKSQPHILNTGASTPPLGRKNTNDSDKAIDNIKGQNLEVNLSPLRGKGVEFDQVKKLMGLCFTEL